MPNFLFVDDHSVVRAGIKLIITQHFADANVWEAENEKQAIEILRSTAIDVMLMDLNMPDSDPIRLIDFITSNYPKIAVIVLTMNDENVYAKRFFKLGIKGFLHKSSDNKEIIRAIEHALTNRVYISDNLKQTIAESYFTGVSENPFDALSDREFQVAKEMLRGKSIHEIATSLSINTSTVSTYKGKIFEKLKIDHNNLVELISLARQHRIL
ncbi:MAG: response regulator transcription factor [Chitinophagia bacterium]|jgi:DNA-binding NarL/FixJ family response regulator